MTGKYLFKSERLGFRNWQDADVDKMAAMNSDPGVMEFFPGLQGRQKTEEFINRMRKQMLDKGYCYFAVDKLEDGTFIGFIGLSGQTFPAAFTPCIDIGWRLSKKEWNKGYATEGAKRCLYYGFNELKLKTIHALAPKVNLRSENVMKKIGMKKISEFVYPLLVNDQRLSECVLYKIGTV